MTFRPTLVALLACVLFAGAAESEGAEVDEVIVLARSHLGDEAALEAVHSVRFVGTVEMMEVTAEGPRPIKAGLQIVMQKPYRQRIELALPDRRETTVLNGYEGWQRVETSESGGRQRLTLLGKDQVRRLRANTWENLAFYRGLAERGGRIEDLGESLIDGRPVRKIAFIHAESIVFRRFFDVRTGRLVLTETEKGSLIREEGELKAGGIRFPAKIITINKMSDGTERAVIVVFDEVVVNEPHPDTFFAVPLGLAL